MSSLSILHWNDVYQVNPKKVPPNLTETIDVTQFCTMLHDLRDRWELRVKDGKRDGLVLFSGDVFSPSVESSVTRGSHMVPVMNELGPDVALTGNHDFDFGYPHLSELIQDTTFPWLLSNIIDSTTSQVPLHLHESQVLERSGVRVGIIGLVEKDWITSVPSWPANFEYRDMEEVGRDLSIRLRDPDGEYKCDLIIALTHSRLPNDITLAKRLFALSPSAQETTPISSLHGVDIILGGHDHFYYISKGAVSWENYDLGQSVLGAEEDHGDVLVVKSGSDFRDLSELTLELEDVPNGVRKKVIKNVKGKRHETKPGSKSSETLKKILQKLLGSVSEALKAPVCKTTVQLDVRSKYIRSAESVVGNWFADIIRHAYDNALCLKGCGGPDGVLICAGALRGDSVYGPGNITLGDILEILPFEDPIVVLELDGETIWAALEASLEPWPSNAGQFPVISGMRVSWDSRRPPGKRVLGIWLLKEIAESTQSSGFESGQATPATGLIDSEEIKRTKMGRKYRIMTREYLAQGHDGYSMLAGQKYLIDCENGQMMSSLVRKYFLGSHFVNKTTRLAKQDRAATLSPSKERHQWKDVARRVLGQSSKAHYQKRINVTAKEHMSSVDCFDGKQARRGTAPGQFELADEDLVTVSPAIDGRLKDEGRTA